MKIILKCYNDGNQIKLKKGFYITIQDITSDYINAYIYKRE